MSRGWRETLQHQQSELQRLEAIDAGLNDAAQDIDSALRKPKSASRLPARQRLQEANQRRHSSVDVDLTRLEGEGGSSEPVQRTFLNEDDPLENLESQSSAHDLYSDIPISVENGLGDGAGTPKAPETTIR